MANLLRLFIKREMRLWHPDSPGMRVTVRRSLFKHWFLGEPSREFATLGETIRAYRA